MKRVVIFVGLVLFLISFASAATLHVGSGQTYSTIQSAVNAASSGDVIKVHSGTYHETVTVTKSDLTIEAYDASNPPELDGADQAFANSAHTWTHVQGKIYKTTYDLPFPHLTPHTFTPSYYGPGGDKGTGYSGIPMMTLYEDDIWLRGYEGLNSIELSTPYSTLADLDPSTDEKSASSREIRIAGRFMYDDANNELYVWTAKEHGEDHPSNHKYYIPIKKNLVIIDAPRVTLRNLVLKHTYHYAIYVKSNGDGSIIENCYIINPGIWAIKTYKAEDIKLLNNFIKLKGFYERQDYISVRFTVLKGDLVLIDGASLTDAKNCEIAGNVITGTYNLGVYGQNCKVHDNIVSKSQSILIIPDVPGHLTPKVSPGYIHNVRVYNNIFHHADFSVFTSYNTWTAGLNQYYGPTWFYRNIIYAVPQINKDGCQESPCDPTPSIFIYQNTFVMGKSVVHHPYDYPVRGRTVYRNNIFYLRHNRGMEMYWVYSDGEKSKGWIYFPFDNGADTDYNVFWRESMYNWGQIARFRNLVDVNNGIYQSYKEGEFAKMQSEQGYDPHSVEADPELVHGSEFATANPFNVKYDALSDMDYKDVISQGYMNLYNQYFPQLYHYFDVQSGSPAINFGETLPSSWPDTVKITDGKPDIGAVEYGGTPCTESWTCTPWSSWSACSDGQQTRTRTCTDQNSCGTTVNKPAESETQGCGFTGEVVAIWPMGITDDLSGNGNTLELHGTISTVTGKNGTAYQFSGDDYLSASDSPSLDFDKQRGTIMLWVKPDDPVSSGHQLLVIDSDFDIELNIQADGDLYFYPHADDGDWENYNLVTNPLQAGKWNHIAVTWDYSIKQVKIYVNGIEQALAIENVPTYWSTLAQTSDWNIGGSPVKPDEYFNGVIDDVRVYSRVLNPSEIQNFYGQGAGQCGPADIFPKNNVIDINELVIFIDRWKSGAIGITDLMSAIGEWKNGC